MYKQVMVILLLAGISLPSAAFAPKKKVYAKECKQRAISMALEGSAKRKFIESCVKQKTQISKKSNKEDKHAEKLKKETD